MRNDALDLAAITRALRDTCIGHTLIALDRVPSTMSIAAAEIAKPTVRSGLVVTAEEQTAGRGRFGRKWDAPPGQALLMTVALKAPDLPHRVVVLPMLAAVSVLQAVVDSAPELESHVQIKWPNDLLLAGADGRFGKVAGILLETAFVGEGAAYALLGMGINVNQDTSAWDAVNAATTGRAVSPTSLRMALGRPCARTLLLIAICRRIAANLQDPDEAMAQWRHHLRTLGQDIDVRQFENDAIVSGRAVDVDADGALIVEQRDGTHRRFQAGDVSLHV